VVQIVPWQRGIGAWEPSAGQFELNCGSHFGLTKFVLKNVRSWILPECAYKTCDYTLFINSENNPLRSLSSVFDFHHWLKLFSLTTFIFVWYSLWGPPNPVLLCVMKVLSENDFNVEEEHENYCGVVKGTWKWFQCSTQALPIDTLKNNQRCCIFILSILTGYKYCFYLTF